MNFPDHLKYTKEHEWVLIEDDAATVGITDYAQGELGDVVFVELPPKGKELKAHDSFGTIEAVKAVSDLYAPLSGRIADVNAELSSTPEIVNKDPYGAGWMVKITLSDPKEVASLMDAAKYKAHVGK